MRAKDTRRSPSIRSRMFVRTTAVMVLVIFCMVMSMRAMMVNRLKGDRIEMTSMEAQNMLTSMDDYLMTLMVKTDALFASEDFTERVTQVPSSPADKINLGTQLRKAMDVAVYSLRYPEISIANYPGGQVYACLYTRNPASYIDDEFVRSYDEIQGEPYVEELLTQQRMFSWCQGSSPGIGSYIAFNRRLLEYRHLTDIGILQVRVPVSKLQQIFSAEQPESVLAYFYLDDLGALICSSTRNPLPDEVDLWDGEGRILDVEGIGQCIVTQAESHMNGGRLICFSSIHTLTESVDFITPVFIGGGIATMVLCAIILFFLSGSLVKGVGQLVRKTQRASSAAALPSPLSPSAE